MNLPVRTLACGCEIRPADGAYMLVPKCGEHAPKAPARPLTAQVESAHGAKPDSYTHGEAP